MNSLSLIVLVTSCMAHANSLESNYLKDLVRARRTPDIERMSTNYEELKVARSACRIQLKEHSVPRACYLALHLEERAKGPTPHRTQDLERLDQLCRESAGNSAPTASEGQYYLSRRCLAWLAEAARISRYRDQGSHDL